MRTYTYAGSSYSASAVAAQQVSKKRKRASFVTEGGARPARAAAAFVEDEDEEEEGGSWTCTACTLNNVFGMIECSVCETARLVRKKMKAPSLVAATKRSLTVKWDLVPDAVAHLVRYRINTDVDWTVMHSNGTALTVKGLVALGTYYLAVRPEFAGGSYGLFTWSANSLPLVACTEDNSSDDEDGDDKSQ